MRRTSLVVAFLVGGCSSPTPELGGAMGRDRLEAPGGHAPSSLPADALTPSSEARKSIEALRTRFQVARMTRYAARGSSHAAASMPVIGAGVATSFAPSNWESVRPSMPEATKRGVLRAGSVELPLRANAMARLEDDVTHVSVGFALREADAAPLAVADGIALYAGALAGGDVVHRVGAEGTEDFVVFETKPAREEVSYEVDVSRVAGLRLVGNTLEFLDEGGAPRLRVAPPYAVDTNGARTEARLAVDGCAYDTDPSGPWGRTVTRAGASHCRVRVTWRAAEYPLILDPVWTTTGSMATARVYHTATRLPSGQVLVAGGSNGAVQSSAELFDGSSSFAATGAMTTPRTDHTATLLPSGQVLLAGGADAGFQPISSAELFDGTASFAPTGAMATTRRRHTATLLLSGKVLVAGGSGGVSAELFDGSASFAPTGAMTMARAQHTATLLPSGQVLLAGGANAMELSSAELFDGSASFAATGSMTTRRYGHTATLLPSGKVLVAGGFNKIVNFQLSSAELFDGSASFAATGSMTWPRVVHTATLLPSGNVLVAGGLIGDNGYLSSAELFDGNASFAVTGSMTAARVNHTATLLSSGEVLVAGGYGLGALTSAELFALEAAGAPCAGGGECLSGICNERCCSAACAGACTTCDAVGACLPVMSAGDPDSCALPLNGSSCDAGGLCQKIQGQPCVLGSDCPTGFCADGVCCDTACSGGPCDACSVAAGAVVAGTCKLLDGAACSDGSACTQTDVCTNGACIGGNPITCAAKDECHEPGICDAVSGICSDPAKADGTTCAGGTCQTGACISSPDAGSSSSSSGASSSSSGSSSSGSSSSSGAGGSGGAAPKSSNDASAPAPVDAGGCGCRSAGTGGAGDRGALGGLVTLGLVLAARRRRVLVQKDAAHCGP